jgi:uncharacterized membrane protein
MGETTRLPEVNTISPSTPFSWLAGAWIDLWRAPAIFLAYGLVVAFAGGMTALGLAVSGLALWSITLAAGFVFIAPIIAMGLYEGGRSLEAGHKPRLMQVVVVRSAFRRDVVLLGLALLFIFGVWIELARVVHGIATSRFDATLAEFITFAISTPAGHGMLIWGTAIGGLLAWFTFCLVAVSAPMLLDSRQDIFVATVTSVRCVLKNTAAMMIWACIIAAMILVSIATGFFALIIVIPWLGLASWRAYRTLVAQPADEKGP